MGLRAGGMGVQVGVCGSGGWREGEGRREDWKAPEIGVRRKMLGLVQVAVLTQLTWGRDYDWPFLSCPLSMSHRLVQGEGVLQKENVVPEPCTPLCDHAHVLRHILVTGKSVVSKVISLFSQMHIKLFELLYSCLWNIFEILFL